GKPAARRLETGQAAGRGEAHAELRFDRASIEERQVSVRRGRGQDLDLARAREVREGADEVAPEPLDERLLQALVRPAVGLRDGLARRGAGETEIPRVELGPADLIIGVREEAGADVRVGELLAGGRR